MVRDGVKIGAGGGAGGEGKGEIFCPPNTWEGICFLEQAHPAGIL